MKKVLLSTFVMALFAIGFSASDEEESSNGSSSSENQTEQKQENSFLGTYEVTDKVGCTIRITLKEDETATVTGIKGNKTTYYCSWRDFTETYGGIEVWYNDDVPYLVFEGGDNSTKNLVNAGGCITPDGWYYVTTEEAKAKNPKWRLKAKKIN